LIDAVRLADTNGVIEERRCVMVYLIDPKEASVRGCSLAYPLYGVPCYDYCRIFCPTVCQLLL